MCVIFWCCCASGVSGILWYGLFMVFCMQSGHVMYLCLLVVFHVYPHCSHLIGCLGLSFLFMFVGSGCSVI